MVHSSKEQQKREPHALGAEAAQIILSSLFGPVADMAMETVQIASTLYTDRFEAAAQKTVNRTNGHEGGFTLGVKHSLGGSFNRARTLIADNANSAPAVPYWKRDYAAAPRFAA